MGKTGKWLKNFLVGSKKDRDKEKAKNNNVTVPENPTTPITVTPTTPKEKRRWSFRRSSASSPAAPIKGLNSPEQLNGGGSGSALFSGSMESESEQKKHALAVAAATAAAADAAVAAAQAAAAVIRLTAGTASRTNPFEEAAAIKIQSAYRAYLARKALRALRGLVKLQALVRGHLVRKQATATLRCMQALVTVQARARGQRIRMAEDSKSLNPRSSFHRKSTRDDRFKHTNHETERLMEENIKIVEMDIGESQVTAAASAKSRNSYSNHPTPERTDHRFSTHSSHSKLDAQQLSPAPSALTELSPRTCSGHFEEYNNCSFATVQSSPQCYSAVPRPETARMPPASYARSEYAESISYEYPLYPNYMANTESSRAKARSQSAPKQRPPEYFERQPSSRRRTSIEGRNTSNVPRAMRMQRSSSHVGSAVHNYQYPWSIKLDRSTVSLKESECGSTSTVLTNINYCRSLASYDITGSRYRSLPPPPLPPTRAV